jgi:hypothetical protein
MRGAPLEITPQLPRPQPSSAQIALLITAIYAGFLLALVSTHPGGLARLIDAGSEMVDRETAPASLQPIQDGYGYDGQFNFRLALNPFTSNETEQGMTLDLPAYRHQRLLYPLLAWTVSLGRPEILPIALPLINLLAIGGLTWAGAELALAAGRSRWWGAVLALAPGIQMGLAYDLAEPLLAGLVIGGILLLGQRRTWSAALLLTLAVLCQEAAVLIPVGIGIVALATEDVKLRARWPVWILPIVTFVLMQVWVNAVWGEAPIRVASGFIAEPLRGIVATIRGQIPPRSLTQALLLAALLYVPVFLGAALLATRTSLASREVTLAWALTSALFLMSTTAIWNAEPMVWRALLVPFLLGNIMLIQSSSLFRFPVLGLSLIFWTQQAARLLWSP